MSEEFSRTLPNKIKKQERGIVNMVSYVNLGTHWVAFLKHSEDVVYFDSDGNLSPPIEKIRYFQSDGSIINITYIYDIIDFDILELIIEMSNSLQQVDHQL